MTADPRKGAAMFRNRITTLQHLELWQTYLTRVMAGDKRGYSRGDSALVEEYFSRDQTRGWLYRAHGQSAEGTAHAPTR